MGVPQPQLVKMIETSKTRHIRLFSHLKGIKDLNSMFVGCSFVLSREGSSSGTNNICNHALSIFFDEEWLNPQCLQTLV